MWGNNTQTDSIDGFQTGDTLRFRIWDKSKNLEYTSRAKFLAGTPSNYQPNGYSVLTELIAVKIVTAVPDFEAGIPDRFALRQNYPNPFNTDTAIEFDLPQPAKVVLTVYDVHGIRVKNLVNGAQSAGRFRIRWNGQDEKGSAVTSGIYVCRLEISGGSQPAAEVSMRKMVYIK